MSGNDRTDLTLRTALRSIRKFFLNDFKSSSQYYKVKIRNPEIFLSAIEKYSAQIVAQFEYQILIETEITKVLQQELAFFLASFFYHKHVATVKKGPAVKEAIDQINKSRYKFTFSSLKWLA